MKRHPPHLIVAIDIAAIFAGAAIGATALSAKGLALAFAAGACACVLSALRHFVNREDKS